MVSSASHGHSKGRTDAGSWWGRPTMFSATASTLQADADHACRGICSYRDVTTSTQKPRGKPPNPDRYYDVWAVTELCEGEAHSAHGPSSPCVSRHGRSRLR